MKRSLPHLFLLAAPALLLVSLNLPWQEAPCGGSTASYFSGDQGTTAGLRNLFADSCFYHRVDGWSSVGQVAALSALLLAFLAAAALARPKLRERLPLGQCALATAYFTSALVVQTRLDARQTGRGLAGGHFHYAYGAYVGVAAGILALLGAAVLRRDELLFYPPRRAWAALGGAVALLAAFLLPWTTSRLFWSSTSSGAGAAVHLSSLGIADASGVIAAVAALRFVVVRWRDGAEAWLERSALSATALLFVAAAFTVSFTATRAYGAWSGLALAAAIVLLTLVDRPRSKSVVWPPWQTIGAGAALAVFVTSLFLPWQQACYPARREFAQLGVSGRCISSNGWTLETSVAVLLALGLVVVALAPRLLSISSTELGVGFALLVATLGFRLETGLSDGVRFNLGYGSIIGLAAAALVVGLALARSRLPRINANRAVTALPAIVVSAAYVAVVVLPWWNVLPSQLWSVLVISLTRISWMTIAAALLGLRLACLWVARLEDDSRSADELIVLPIGLAVLAVLDAVHFGIADITWNTGILEGLAVSLAVLGAIEGAGGFQKVRIPGILRIDRI